ncbi:Hypothetical predicted protein, partial [Pelobates cultripes]
MSYRYEGAAYNEEVKRQLTRYGPDPSAETIMATMHELDAENRAAHLFELKLHAILGRFKNKGHIPGVGTVGPTPHIEHFQLHFVGSLS